MIALKVIHINMYLADYADIYAQREKGIAGFCVRLCGM